MLTQGTSRAIGQDSPKTDSATFIRIWGSGFKSCDYGHG